jgi:3-oxoacyl-[acyl-carrier-protein] synthase II
MRDVVVTGLGAVSALGRNVPELWDAVQQGRCGIDTIRRFDTTAFSVHTGAVAHSDCAGTDGFTLCRDFSLTAATEALRDAGLSLTQRIAPERIGFVFGTGLTDRSVPLNEMVEALGDALGARGPRLTVSTACSSSTGALGLACDLIAMRAADVVIAGGADVLTPEVFAGFHALGVLTSLRCAPFSVNAGTTLGEGAGFVVLERLEHAQRRGVNVRCVLAGYGLSADAWHETSPDPKGTGIERAISAALADAGAAPDTVGYVNAHGSGTQANDSAEWLGIQRALGARAATIPVSSTKGALGHAQGAAGILEAIVTMLGMQSGVVPPTLNFAAPRPHGPTDPVPGERPRAMRVERAVSVNAAFGGANAAVVLDRAPASHSNGTRPRGRVTLNGVGLIGTSDFDITTIVPGADPRGLDRAARYLSAATALAVRDSGIPMNRALRDRTGLLVGQIHASPDSLRDFSDSIATHGLPQLSAVAFARIVLNAAAGACSKLLSLRGPLSVITTGQASGITAVVLAAELLASRSDVAMMLAGAVDVRAVAQDESPTDEQTEGAACVLLRRGDSDAARHVDDIELAGWGIAGPGRVDEAIRIAMHGIDARGVCVVSLDDRPGAAGALFGVAEVSRALRDGHERLILFTSTSASISSALLLAACSNVS